MSETNDMRTQNFSLPLSDEDFEYIEELHRQLAPSPQAFSLVWTHNKIVASLALAIAKKYREHYFAEISAADAATSDVQLAWDGALPNPDLAYLGGLIHDIGVYKVFAPTGEFDRSRYIRHGIEGYEILLHNGFGENLAQFALNHTGVGITRQEVERQGLPLPVRDYVPQTIEQEVVMYADKFHTKSTPPTFVSLSSARASAARFGGTNAERFNVLAARYGNPELTTLAETYGMKIRQTPHQIVTPQSRMHNETELGARRNGQ